MLKISQMKLDVRKLPVTEETRKVDYAAERALLLKELLKILRIPEADLLDFHIVKKSSDDKWDYARVKEKIDREIAQNSTLVLPMATLIESGNHIAQAPCNRFEVANALADIIKKVAMEEEPWAAFTFQNELWNKDNLMKCEYLMPTVVSDLIHEGRVQCDVLSTSSVWYGITYKEDKEYVVESLKKMMDEGLYPDGVWKK